MKTDTTTPRNIAYALLILYAGLAVGMFFMPLGDSPNKETIGHMASTLENLLLIMAGYIYGSSMGSRAKDKPNLDPDAGPIHTSHSETTTVETQTSQAATVVPESDGKL